MKNRLPISISLPDKFLDEECRCGYLVSSKLKKIWAVELDLLNVFLDVCNRNNIRVQVFAGTLLGAIRHNGFIPWDDDVDVCMDRENFNKLLSLPESEFPNPYFLQTAYTDQTFYCAYARFRNSCTTGVICGQESPSYNNGIYIDIFVLDGLPRNSFVRKIHELVLALITRFITERNDTKPKYQTFVSYLIFILGPFLRRIPYSTLVTAHAKLLSLFTATAEYLTMVTHGGWHCNRYRLLKSEIDNCVNHAFESIEVPVPKNYDRVLRRMYGEYTKFPAVAERGKWHEGQLHFDPDTPYKEYLRRKAVV